MCSATHIDCGVCIVASGCTDEQSLWETTNVVIT